MVKVLIYNILICSMQINSPKEESYENKKELSKKFQQEFKMIQINLYSRMPPPHPPVGNY